MALRLGHVLTGGIILAAMCAMYGCKSEEKAKEKLATTTYVIAPDTHEQWPRERWLVDPDIKRITALHAADKNDEAIAAATAVIERDSDKFDSPRWERATKAEALMLRAEMSPEGALADVRRAAALGHAAAYYHVVAHLLVAAARDGVPPPDEEVFENLLTGAQLGVPECIDQIQLVLKARGRGDEIDYWFLLERMGEDDSKVLHFRDHIWPSGFDERDRARLTESMRKRSLSGGEVEATLRDVPGRSVLSAATVDLYMRGRLEFVWRAFFFRETQSMTLSEFSADFKKAIRELSPLVDVFLLIESDGPVDGAVALPSGKLAAQLLPGDFVLVRCGGIAHYALVWSIEREAGTIAFLDPFHEFWTSKQNTCVSAPALHSWHHRDFVTISLSEIEPMLAALLTIRDRQSD